MPPLPESNKLVFSDIHAVGSNLVVLGGYDLESERSLLILFWFLIFYCPSGVVALTYVPSGPILFFGSATDGDHRTIYVGGGVVDVKRKTVQFAWTFQKGVTNVKAWEVPHHQYIPETTRVLKFLTCQQDSGWKTTMCSLRPYILREDVSNVGIKNCTHHVIMMWLY